MTVAAKLDPSRLPRPVRVGAAVAAIALGLLGVLTRGTSLNAEDLTRNDFTQDYVAARAAIDGFDPYGDTRALASRYVREDSLREVAPVVLRNPHAPAQVLLAYPVTPMPYRAARVVWLLVMAAMLAAGVAVVVREMGWSRATAVVAGIGALALPVSQKDLLYGNVDSALLLVLALGWRDLRRERDARAGLLFGVASALKLFPLFLLIPLVRRRRLRAIAYQLGAAAALNVAATLVLVRSLDSGFLDASSANFRFWRAAPMNLSLVAIPFRWLTRSHWTQHATDAPALAAALALLAVALCVAAAWRAPGRTSGDDVWHAVPFMLLVSPLSWDYAGVLVVPLLIVAAAHLARSGQRAPLVAVVGAVLVIIGIPPVLPDPVKPISPAVQLFGYALPSYGLMVLAAASYMKPRRRAAHV
jgi:hypothetical protein